MTWPLEFALEDQNCVQNLETPDWVQEGQPDDISTFRPKTRRLKNILTAMEELLQTAVDRTSIHSTAAPTSTTAKFYFDSCYASSGTLSPPLDQDLETVAALHTRRTSPSARLQPKSQTAATDLNPLSPIPITQEELDKMWAVTPTGQPLRPIPISQQYFAKWDLDDEAPAADFTIDVKSSPPPSPPPSSLTQESEEETESEPATDCEESSCDDS